MKYTTSNRISPIFLVLPFCYRQNRCERSVAAAPEMLQRPGIWFENRFWKGKGANESLKNRSIYIYNIYIQVLYRKNSH